MRLSAFLLSCLFLFTSCASILNAEYQKVYINGDQLSSVSINGEKAKPNRTGKYKLKRDKKAKQITAHREGYLDENIAVFPYKKSPLVILSWVPFGLLYLIPPLFDAGPKSFDYQKSIDLPTPRIKELALKQEDIKELMLNTVSVDIDPENLRYRRFSSYRSFMKRKDEVYTQKANTEEGVKMENTIFSDVMNELLVEKGFIDTSRHYLSNSYLNNLLVSATITGSTFHNIKGRSLMYSGRTDIFYCDLTIKWEILDLYKNTLYETETNTTSGQMALTFFKNESGGRYAAIKEAVERGFLILMTNDRVEELLLDRSILDTESDMPMLFLPKSESYVSTIGEAVKSSVTIKSEAGHGSGFVIAPNGYIITNYHVIANAEELTVVFNNGAELGDVEVIRVSKVYDLALIKVTAKSLKPFLLDASPEIPIGKEIYAVGTPTSEDLAQTVSKGIISGKRKLDNLADLVQIDASINGGNSGGAIVDKKGLVYGVVSSKISGAGIEGVAFGIPANQVLDRLKLAFQ
jgi:serine protease Do